MIMTLLIHLLMRLTTIFERGVPADEPPANTQLISEEIPSNSLEKE
jgi:hypothetical protein